MKRNYRHSLFLLTLFIGSCCTKKECGLNIYPTITLKVVRTQGAPIDHIKVLRLQKGTDKTIDSLSLSAGTYIWLGPDRFGNVDTWKDYDYAFHADGTPSDTIKNIDFEKHTTQVECNTCFPEGRSEEEQTTYTNLSYEFKGRRYTDKDTAIVNL